MAIFLLLCAQGTLDAANRKDGGDWSLGGTFSLRGVGLGAERSSESGAAFESFSLTLDLIDILDGTASTPGLKATYHHNLIVQDFQAGKYVLYLGPGLTAGRVRDTRGHLGLMAGLSGDAGLRMQCLHSITLSVEFQLDFALQFKNRIRPDMSLYATGIRNAYLPYVKIQYRF